MPDNTSLDPPVHGGNFDPNHYNRASRQIDNQNPPSIWAPGPSHGGDFDPNRIDANYFSQQRQWQNSSLATAPNAVQKEFYGLTGSDHPNQMHSSNPSEEHLGVSSRFCSVANISSFLAWLTHDDSLTPYLWKLCVMVLAVQVAQSTLLKAQRHSWNQLPPSSLRILLPQEIQILPR